MKNVIFSLLVIFLSINVAKGQYFQTGQDPSSIRWRQINTTNFQIIFPEEFEKQAQKISFIWRKYTTTDQNH